MPPLALTAMSFKYQSHSKLLSSADNKSQQAFLGCKYSHSVCQLTLSHIAFYITSQQALLRQHDLLKNSTGLGDGGEDVIETVVTGVTDTGNESSRASLATQSP